MICWRWCKGVPVVLGSAAKRLCRGGWKMALRLVLCGRTPYLILLLVLTAVSFLVYATFDIYSADMGFRDRRRSPAPQVHFQCPKADGKDLFQPPTRPIPDSKVSQRTDLQMLVLVETQFSALGKEILTVLDSLRMKYRVEVAGKSLPPLTTVSRGNYAVVIFENVKKYVNMDPWNRQLLDKYCRDYSVGLIFFMQSREDTFYRRAKVKGFPLYVSDNINVAEVQLNRNSSMFHITRPTGSTYPPQSKAADWVVFHSDHPGYESVLSASGAALSRTKDHPKSLPNVTRYDPGVYHGDVVMLDNGRVDGIRRLYFGYDFRLWIIRLLLIDGITFLSQNRILLTLNRYVQIDIDDIFVGETGYRMVAEDVDALVAAQQRFRELISGFTFNLGFSGKFFHKGNRFEQLGDDMLISKASEFWWFPHMWRHNKVHRLNESTLEAHMFANKKFAEEFNIPVRWRYAVAPHHSGVYPVHEPLYETWKQIWGIQVTSTEEYPHFKPAFQRRGFIHKGIAVLPRQTCGLYTHTVFMERFPGGKERLDAMIMGGDLFFTLLYNPFLIFMTHQSNYANDRLALYAFETLFRFVNCWTNLKLLATTPVQLAEKYFRRYPEEKDPIWGNPCLDKRLLNIWSPEKSCAQLPKVLVIGPQKTGSTALYSFMKMHPGLLSNDNNGKNEETQFFSGKNYSNGLDWYLEFFPTVDNVSGAPLIYEKSASYFDHERAPIRVKALLPDVKLISLIVSPSKRAYSWYQHMKAHSDPMAMSYSFFEVLSASEDSPKRLWSLRSRCLAPGTYAEHLEMWLENFTAKQLLILDGELLKKNPSAIMQQVQEFLLIQPVLNYSRLLKFVPSKGFYCQLVSTESDKTKCLGPGKGRHYPPMDDLSRRYLQRYYRPHNVALHRLLTRLGYGTPQWLQAELKEIVE